MKVKAADKLDCILFPERDLTSDVHVGIDIYDVGGGGGGGGGGGELA